jgi:hypothetical protein
MLSSAWVPATLEGSYEPADEVAARQLRLTDQALVLVWPSIGDPQGDGGIVFTCGLSDTFALEVAGGVYDVATAVLDDRHDELKGVGIEGLQLPGRHIQVSFFR